MISPKSMLLPWMALSFININKAAPPTPNVNPIAFTDVNPSFKTIAAMMVIKMGVANERSEL